MALTIDQIASRLNLSKTETIAFLKSHDIHVTANQSFLSDQDFKKLVKAIETAKTATPTQPKTPTTTTGATHDSAAATQRSQQAMQHLCKNYKIFIDTCSLLDDCVDTFFENIIPILHECNNTLIVPTRVKDELTKHANNDQNPALQRKAIASLEMLALLLEKKIAVLQGEETDPFADNVFHFVFTKFRTQHRLLLITQDRRLSDDILRLNESQSSKGYPVYTRRINKFGFLSTLRPMDQTSGSPTGPSSKPIPSRPTPRPEPEQSSDDDTFTLSTTLTQVPATSLNVQTIPSTGHKVYAFRNHTSEEIQLKEAVASGGEGTIYLTNTNYVAKIYKKECLDRRRFEKIKLMLTKKIKCEGICYPVALLYNAKHEFVGYLMPKAQGKILQTIFIKPRFIKEFPNWDKRDTAQLCITILEKIKYLHERNIIIGDLNPNNILIVSPTEVYLVDTDSYQIESFPCPVGTINYTAPEIQRRPFNTFLRTIGNENFAVATLLFMIMLPGKPPYALQGGESPVDNIINMDFAYPFGQQTNRKTPDGPWRYIWSHLTYDLKKAFYQTFKKGEEYSTEHTRLPVDEWLSMFEYYLHLLKSGKLAEQDEMSVQLFPIRHKLNKNVSYVECKLCHEQTPEQSCRNGICPTCSQKGEVARCKRCNNEFIFTNFKKYIQNIKQPFYCPTCFEKRHETYKTLQCGTCYKSFNVSWDDYEFYTLKGYELPKRCKPCRENRNPTVTQTMRPSQPSPAIPTTLKSLISRLFK